MFEEYQKKLLSNLEGLRQWNGVYRASWSDEYAYTWIRDNHWNVLSVLNHDVDKYLQTCHTHLDFLKKYEYDYDHKLSWLIKDPNVYGSMHRMRRFVNPKVNFDGTEIEGLEWNHIQLDTLPYYILMIYNGWKKGLSIFRDDCDRDMIQLLVDIIVAMDICNKKYGASWEEELDCFTSNIGLCMRALEVAYEMGFNVDREELRRIRRKFYGQFPLERNGRDCDLTLLFLCVIDGILEKVDIDELLINVAQELHGHHFCKRYKGDVYKPFDRSMYCNDWKQPCIDEMEWCMSAGYLSIIYAKRGDVAIAKHYIEKLITLFPDGNIPEGIEGSSCRPCYNTPLAWSMSMASLGIDAINGRFV